MIFFGTRSLSRVIRSGSEVRDLRVHLGNERLHATAGSLRLDAFAIFCARLAPSSFFYREADLLAVGDLERVSIRIADECPVADRWAGVLRAAQ